MKIGSLFKKEGNLPGSAGIPVNEVMQLKKQGLSSDKIVEELKQMGFTLTQIRDAMAQAEIKGQVNNASKGNYDNAGLPPMPPAPDDESGLPSPDSLRAPDMAPNAPSANPPEGRGVVNSAPGEGPLDMPEIPMGGVKPSTEQLKPLQMEEEKPSVGGVSHEKIEGLIEAIVEEKWEDIEAGIMEITDWKDKITSKMEELEKKMSSLEIQMVDIDKKATVKTEKYEKTIEEVNVQMGAFERAMRDVVPALVGGIKELRDVVIEAKRQRKQPPVE
ncbi:MAG: hypothetical protein PHW96_04095 [Candidatus Nanoarchaeia archaeon]|nr:hypothetical protein [Candidatus Nanoarchaeia archaeon]